MTVRRRSVTALVAEPEEILQRKVIMLARLLGWRVHHTHNSIHSPSGWPDLAMVRGKRIVFAELKSQTGRLTLEQQSWLDELRGVPCAEVFIWRPSDWPQIEQVLR
jgi:hypothetical protein